MTRRVARYGAKQDDVRLVRYAQAWPVTGTRAETTAAILRDSAQQAGLSGRSLMGRAVAAGVTGLDAGVLLVGSFVKDPLDAPNRPDSYNGTPVPKKVNDLGVIGPAVPGSLLTPDPREESAALDQARAEE